MAGTIGLMIVDHLLQPDADAPIVDEVPAEAEEALSNEAIASIINERRSPRGRTRLQEASLLGDESAVLSLLRDSAVNVDARTLLGRETALHLAVKGSHRRVAYQLILHGADPRSRNKYGWTPLHYATTRAMVRLLLANGAEPEPLSAEADIAARRAIEDETIDSQRRKDKIAILAERDKQAKIDAIIAARVEAKADRARQRKKDAVRRDYLAWRRGSDFATSSGTSN